MFPAFLLSCLIVCGSCQLSISNALLWPARKNNNCTPEHRNATQIIINAGPEPKTHGSLSFIFEHSIIKVEVARDNESTGKHDRRPCGFDFGDVDT